LNNGKEAKRLPVEVDEALIAICSTGKGRCWYCDSKLPKARKAIRDGWDVQRVEEQPVASVILVCPTCLREDDKVHVTAFTLQSRRAPKPRRQHLRPLSAV